MGTTVITGGAGGMGLATAAIVGREQPVLLSDIDAERLDVAVARLRGDGIDATAMVCDITDRRQVEALFARAREIGPVSAVVHAAGISPQMGAVEPIIRINAVGTINVVRAGLAQAAPGFALVNVASLAGHMLPKFLRPHRAYRWAAADPAVFVRKMTRAANRAPLAARPGLAYSLSKHFVIWYSRTQAAAFGVEDARILSVSPGSFDTDMGRLEEESGSGRLIEHAALKRFGTPCEIAELLAFCASGKAGYLTGVDILCDGGTKAGLDFRAILAMARNTH
ncbi:SDR family oxidoreductase [Nocardia aurea]|uniref:SDR family oxidoreductase n=1 Tax=Nocardia aurea TaxID=2144174 RepID=UPI0033A4B7B8